MYKYTYFDIFIRAPFFFFFINGWINLKITGRHFVCSILIRMPRSTFRLRIECGEGHRIWRAYARGYMYVNNFFFFWFWEPP